MRLSIAHIPCAHRYRSIVPTPRPVDPLSEWAHALALAPSGARRLTSGPSRMQAPPASTLVHVSSPHTRRHSVEALVARSPSVSHSRPKDFGVPSERSAQPTVLGATPRRRLVNVQVGHLRGRGKPRIRFHRHDKRACSLRRCLLALNLRLGPAARCLGAQLGPPITVNQRCGNYD